MQAPETLPAPKLCCVRRHRREGECAPKASTSSPEEPGRVLSTRLPRLPFLPTHHDGSDRSWERACGQAAPKCFTVAARTHVQRHELAGAQGASRCSEEFWLSYGPNIWLKCCKYFSRSAVFELYLFISKKERSVHME